MKRITLLILTIIGTLALYATPKFEAGKSYHIVCYQFPQGCVTDGATAGANTPLYYHFPATANAEDMWIITAQYDSPSTVTIQNAKTGQYVTYDGVRQDSPELRRYISMTDEMDGENSVWYLQENGNGYYCIRNWENFSQTWDVRVDS